jgi:hypothetical protein
MRKKAILAGVLACISFTAQAQDNKAEEPKGKVILEVFGLQPTSAPELI